MHSRLRMMLCLAVVFSSTTTAFSQTNAQTKLDEFIATDNTGRDVKSTPVVDDLAYLRRVYVDLIGRIPSAEEIREYQSWPADERREMAVDALLDNPRFVDRWTVFFADMLRIRSNAQGGRQFLAFVHQSLRDGMPYDEMCRELIRSNGKPSQVPEVGYILGDDVDPMALAGATAQVFMGVRIACAQCHDHPFDVWTREQFYGFAAYFGKTRRMVAPVTETLYTTEADETTILWPPEDAAQGEKRTPVVPKFPFEITNEDRPSKPIARLTAKRQSAAEALAAKSGEVSVDDLLVESDGKVKDRTDGKVAELIDVKAEVRNQTNKLNIYDDIYRPSQLRRELAELVTSPYNRYFSQALVNRVWKELVGRGFVEPIDDFSESNQPSHPQAINYLADEFVASGFDIRTLMRLVVTSDTYSRSHLFDADDQTREAAERAFAAAPLRRMISESLFDSIVQAGHLFDTKYLPGTNKRIVEQMVRVAIEDDKGSDLESVVADSTKTAAMPQDQVVMRAPTGYDLESAIEVDFDAVLNEDDAAPSIEQMRAMSAEELQAMEMAKEMEARRRRPGVKYITKTVKREVDVNPRFASAMRMASPADPNHFLRVFGQPGRNGLGDHRVDEASMRQALMMLNGSLTHEASRVGNKERMHRLLVGEDADLDEAVRLAYLEILTRVPTDEELADAKTLIGESAGPVEGMADLRWVLLNCHEFRFLP